MKKPILIALLITGSFLVLSCESNKKKEPENKQEQTQNQRPKAELPISVGSVHASLQVLSISDNNTMKVKIVEILGYGANTSPINKGKEIMISFHQSISTSEIKKGDTFNAFMSKAPVGMGMDSAGSPESWNISQLTD